jgi:hypothetical protein
MSLVSRMPRDQWLRIGDHLATALAPLLPPGTSIVTQPLGIFITSPEGGSLLSRGFMIVPTPRSFQVRQQTRSAIQQAIEWIEKSAGAKWRWARSDVAVEAKPLGGGTMHVKVVIAGGKEELAFEFTA